MRASEADDLNQGSASLAGRVACERNRGAIKPIESAIAAPLNLQLMEPIMSRKKMLIAMTAVALGIAGAVSAAQAGSKDDDDVGGSKIGPSGQWFGAPPAQDTFGYVPLTTKHVRGKRERRD